MKKLLSVILVITMLFAVMAPCACAATEAERTPIIYIRGNGEALYYPDGTPLAATMQDVNLGGDGEDGGINKDVIVETAVNILKPFILEGMIFDQWDNYGRAIYEEISPLFPDAGLDGDGNPLAGTGVSTSALASSEANSKSDRLFKADGVYDFCYDWRLSPYDHTARLNTYIENIIKATGKSQVSIYSRCLGGSLLSAYLEEYGHLGYVKNVMFSDSLSNEATIISKAFSGQVEFDANLVERYVGQVDYCGNYNYGVGFVFGELLSEIVYKSMSFFTQIGATDAALGGVEALYEKLYQALVPALAHAAGIATQANYYSCIADEDMDAALNLMFGEEGSELRTKYAGLIEKIQRYRNNITKDLDGFYDEVKANGTHIGFLAKYGYLNAPFTKDADLLSDGLVSLEHAAYGATCAKIGKTFSDDYVAARVAEGDGKYISPDRQVDLSTAYSPDTTWVFKRTHHQISAETNFIIYAFLKGTNETVESLGTSYFYVYDDVTGNAEPMTEDNCYDFDWLNNTVEEPTEESIFVAAMRWFTMLFKVITMLLKGEISFSDAKELL